MHLSHTLMTVLVLNVQSTVCTEQFRYVYEPSLNDQRCTSTEHRFTIQTTSKIRCGQICSQDGDCNSFFFSSSTSECTGCVSVMSDPCLSCEHSVSGTVYYRSEGSQIEAEYLYAPRIGAEYLHAPRIGAEYLHGPQIEGDDFSDSEEIEAEYLPGSQIEAEDLLGPQVEADNLHGSQIEADDCSGIKQNFPSATSGVYSVRLSSDRTISVYCDMDTDGGGWTVFQYRHNGSIDFYRTFQEYTDGFGDVNDEFWLGLQNIHEMAPPEVSSKINLYVEDGFGSSHVDKALYFAVGPSPCFRVTLHAGDSSLCYSHGACFSTKDYGNACAVTRRSAWWFFQCTWINPNGLYVTPGTSATTPDSWAGIVHVPWRSFDSLAVTKIMFRKNE